MNEFPVTSDSINSPIRWLDAVPDSWGWSRLKALLNERNVRNHPGEPLLAATQSMGVVRKERYGQRTVVVQRGFEQLKLVEPGDFVISLRSFQGGIEYARDRGIISAAYTILRAADPSSQRYIAYLLKSRAFLDAIQNCVVGIREGQNVDWKRLGRELVPVPPRVDQTLIVRYLDNAELRIARAIQAKERLAGLVAERREAVVTAYLRGNVKPGRPSLDSGIPGLGTLPADWQLLPVKSVWKSVDVRSKTGQEERLTVSARSGVVPRSTKTVTMFEAATYVGHKVVEPDQLVINSLWAWAGGLGVSEHSGLVSPVYGVYGLKDPFGMNPAFFHALLRSNLMQWQFQVLSKGIWKSRLQLSDDAFLSMRIPVPPLAEQNAIARQIADATSTMDAALEAIANEVGLLREYRMRLISDVVTGKKDVRADAARMKDVDSVELASVLAGVTMTENDELGEDDDAE